jgi:hypothetical protein
VSRWARPLTRRHRMPPAARSSRLAAVFATAALVAAGCSGGGGGSTTASGPTRAAYLAEAKRICVGYQNRIADLKAPADLRALADQGERAIDLQQAELQELRRLTPPTADARSIDAILDHLDQSIATARKLVAAARDGDLAAVNAAAATLRGQLAEANRLAKPYGLDLCTS